MCGISGIIDKNFSKIREKDIKAINDLIIHRGPDAEGFYFYKNFAFGHRRLSIIDLSDAAGQPMFYEDKYVIIFNGEIYNYIEIREELKKEGYSFKTRSDTEVILASYDKWGINCVERFNGMWALALYDKKNQNIFFSRDRFGIKPLYFTEVDNKFVFGSEIKQLLYFFKKRTLNLRIFLDYLITGFVEHTESTFFEKIYKLPPAHNMIYNLQSNNYKIERYYNIKIHHDYMKLSLDESIDIFRNIFYNSVKLRLRSDVLVGTCLSGGTDSSAIAALAGKLNREKSQEKFIAITAKSTELLTDESAFAKMVVKYSDLDWRTTEPSFEIFSKSIDDLIYYQEEPFGSPSVLMQYEVFKKAKDAGCVVMLDGQGGDEILLGYERYYAAYIKSLPFLKKIIESYRSVSCSRLTLKYLFAYYFYFTNYNLRIKILRERYIFVKNEILKKWDKEFIRNSVDSYKDIHKMQLLELSSLQLPHLLKYEDKNSMKHSIESRLPFLDYRVVETALSIDNAMKIHKGWTKYILRKSIEDIVPKQIAWRKNKIGFNAPESSWMNELDTIILNSIKKSYILNEVCKFEELLQQYHKLGFRTKWKLYNTVKWEEKYNIEL